LNFVSAFLTTDFTKKTRMGNISSDNSSPSEVCMFEVCQDCELEIRDREVSHHLCDMSVVEFFDDLGIDDHVSPNNKIRHNCVDKNALVVDVVAALLVDDVATIAELDNKRILVGPFAQPRPKGIENPHARADNRLAEFTMQKLVFNHILIRVNPWYPWLSIFSGLQRFVA